MEENILETLRKRRGTREGACSLLKDAIDTGCTGKGLKFLCSLIEELDEEIARLELQQCFALQDKAFMEDGEMRL